jgi:hypothetical protein
VQRDFRLTRRGDKAQHVEYQLSCAIPGLDQCPVTAGVAVSAGPAGQCELFGGRGGSRAADKRPPGYRG